MVEMLALRTLKVIGEKLRCGPGARLVYYVFSDEERVCARKGGFGRGNGERD